MLADALHTMTANERWALALQQPCPANNKQSGKTVSMEAGGSEWRAGSRPTPPLARDKYAEECMVARNYLRACSLEQMELNEKRQAARAFDGLSHRQVAQMARTSDMTAFISRWQYLCALHGYSVAEADGWLKPAAAAEVVAEVDADLKAMSERANALAALQRKEVERMGQDARAKDQYAKIERTLEAKTEAVVVDSLPLWFEALDDFAEKLAAIKANRLGDWDEFNAWLQTEYDAEDLAEFNCDEEEDLDIYKDFRAKRAR